MRASRLVSIILLLQARGQMTAGQLAAELDVSVRTIYRDVGSLQAAGIPLYGDAGPAGGYQLVAGYRTRLTGMTAAEAEAEYQDRPPISALAACLPRPSSSLTPRCPPRCAPGRHMSASGSTWTRPAGTTTVTRCRI